MIARDTRVVYHYHIIVMTAHGDDRLVQGYSFSTFNDQEGIFRKGIILYLVHFTLGSHGFSSVELSNK